MTETAIVAIAAAVIAATPPTIVAWLSFSQSRTNSLKADQTAKKVDEVHALANSQLSSVTSALAIANEKILGLEKMISALAILPKRSGRANARSTRT